MNRSKSELRLPCIQALVLLITTFCSTQPALSYTVRMFGCGKAVVAWARQPVWEAKKFDNYTLEPRFCNLSNLDGGQCGFFVSKDSDKSLVVVDSGTPPIGFMLDSSSEDQIRKLRIRLIMQTQSPVPKFSTIDLTGSVLKLEQHASRSDVYWMDPRKLLAKDGFTAINRVYVYFDEQDPGALEYHGTILQHKAHNSEFVSVETPNQFECVNVDVKKKDCRVLDWQPD